MTATPKTTETPGLREALEPLAKLGGHLSERDTMAGLLYRAAFWDCPEDVVIYQDGMGGAISVGDVRRARTALSATPQSGESLLDGAVTANKLAEDALRNVIRIAEAEIARLRKELDDKK